MIVFKDGKIFIQNDGQLQETTDPTLIGLAIKDFIEENEGKSIVIEAFHSSDMIKAPGFYTTLCHHCESTFVK